MRVYHLLSLKYALDDMKHHRLKVARFEDLNDPFELLSVELSDRETRRHFNAWRKNTMAQYGLLCFSRSWRSPVPWSHYADKHRGICLGFDVPDRLLQEVTYLETRAPLANLLQQGASSDQPGPLFHTKFAHWRYEDEIRRIVRLDQAIEQDGRQFWPFGTELHLKEVIAGGRCDVAKAELIRLLGDQVREVTLTKARLAFTTFEVVRQQRGFAKSRHRRTTQSSGRRLALLTPAADRGR